MRAQHVARGKAADSECPVVLSISVQDVTGMEVLER